MAQLVKPSWRPEKFLTTFQKLSRGIWPWTTGIKSQLPEHYKERYIESHQRPRKAIHYEKNEEKWHWIDGERKPVQNVPIPIFYPKEADKGLWGGEGIVQGLKRGGDSGHIPWVAAMWKPFLTKRALYSEILDRWMEINVTLRTLDLIDEALGFDNYILKTHQVDLRSRLGERLRREMLTTLLNKSMYPDDPKKRDDIYEKYKEFLVPEEEIEWLGLTIEEAELKMYDILEDQYRANIKPFKYKFAEELIEKFERGELDEPDEKSSSSDWISKINPFKSGSKS